jgi:hypothetical protein
MPNDTADIRLSRALEAAARRYTEALRTAERVRLESFEARSILARLGLPPALASAALAGAPLTDLERAAALSPLRAENGRLNRLARAGSPAYSLNRHIAIRRLVAAMEQSAPKPAAPSSASGRWRSPRRKPQRSPVPSRDRASYSTKTRELAAAPVESITEMSTNPGSSGVQDA